ncbi:MAG: cytochrome c maturation protein CcmE [Acidimicrobiales bacterium]|nr:cytochrome c maturation protein CcmE [Acidimicrobiales bacterium]
MTDRNTAFFSDEKSGENTLTSEDLTSRSLDSSNGLANTDLNLLAKKVEKSKKARKRRLIVVAIVLICAFGYLMYQGLTNSIQYFKTVDQAVADRSTLGTSTFRVEGTVVDGSIRRNGAQTLFSISSNGVTLPIIDSGSPPSLFQQGIPVVLVGHFDSGSGPGDTSLTFETNQIMVKHSSVYIAEHPNRVKAQNGTSR